MSRTSRADIPILLFRKAVFYSDATHYAWLFTCGGVYLPVCSCCGWVSAVPASLTNCLCVYPGCCSMSVWTTCLSLFLCYADVPLRSERLSQVEHWVGLNLGDIVWSDTLTCHFPCGVSHHHLSVERRSAHQPGKTARKTAVTALCLQENCDDHIKKHPAKKGIFIACVRASWAPLKMSELKPLILKFVFPHPLITAVPVHAYLE